MLTVKELFYKILKYLVDKDALGTKIDVGLPFLDSDDSYESRKKLSDALKYLNDERFIVLAGRPLNMLSTNAGRYPSKYHTELQASLTKLGEKEFESLTNKMDKEKIKKFLFESRGQLIVLTEDSNDQSYEMITYCYEKGFLSFYGEGCYRVSAKGLDFINGKHQQDAQQQTTFHIHGTNPRVYQNSIDNSTNYYRDDKLFELLKSFIESNIDNNSELITLLSLMQEQQGKPQFLDFYFEFISKISSHITVYGSLLTGLYTLIQGSQ